MKELAALIVVASMVFLNVNVAWQNYTVRMSAQETIAKEECTGCSTCFG